MKAAGIVVSSRSSSPSLFSSCVPDTLQLAATLPGAGRAGSGHGSGQRRAGGRPAPNQRAGGGEAVEHPRGSVIRRWRRAQGCDSSEAWPGRQRLPARGSAAGPGRSRSARGAPAGFGVDASALGGSLPGGGGAAAFGGPSPR
eukprot:gene2170-biopygen959